MRVRIRRSDEGLGARLVSAIRTYVPGAWVQPSKDDLIALYRLRYRIAFDEAKYDTAMIFLNKILEVDPVNVEAKLSKGDLYHRHFGDVDRAVEQYAKVLRLVPNGNDAHHQARQSLDELLARFS